MIRRRPAAKEFSVHRLITRASDLSRIMQDHRQNRTLATSGPSLPKSGMVNLLSAEDPPKPQGGRDVEGQRVFDRLRGSIFGVQSGPTLVGRWHILRRLGRGAMGTVYEAHDPELDRPVAIKVLHPMPPELEAARRLRLRREAQAMARVEHPNLVEVHDVCADAPQPYVVMELVAGDTLRAWQERVERGWRELVTAYLGACRGLAALHAAGLVHRDFKPENAMVDARGRIKVVDFGLVYAERIDEDLPGPLAATLTRDGLLVGTLSYMSPEQLQGTRGDARSDQFSLCAALYEAVYAARPYVGHDPETLLADIAERVPPLWPNPRRAPRWLGRALRRGLARRPEQRFPDMDALIDALERGLARRRRDAWLALAGTTLAGLAAIAVARTQDPCDDAATELVGAWDPAQESVIRGRFLAQRLPQGEREWSRLSASVRTSRERWTRLRTETCVALRQAAPATWVLHRGQCLEEARQFMRKLAGSYLEAEPQHVLHARAAAAELAARVQRCEHIGPAAPGRLPPAVDVRIQDALLEAEAEQATGRLTRAEEAARRAVELAERTDVDAARAEALHRLGRILGHRRRTRAALEHLAAASRAATRAGHIAIRVDARLFAAKLRLLDLGSAEGIDAETVDLEDAITGLQRAGVDVRAQQAELLEVRAFTDRLEGSLDPAMDRFAHALELHGERLGASWSHPCPGLPRIAVPDPAVDVPESPIELVRGLNNLALVIGDMPAHKACAESVYRAALALSEERLGELHPVSIDVRFDYAEHLGQQGRFDEQLAVLNPVLDASALQFGDDSVPLADALLALATLAADRGSMASAKEWCLRAVALFEAHCDEQGCPVNYGNALLALAELARIGGDLEGAVSAYERACTQLALRPETAESQVACLYYLTEVLDGLGRHDEARTVQAAAEPLFLRLGVVDDALVELRRRLNRENNQENKDAPPDRK